MSIHLHIERLVFDGVLSDARQAERVKESVERELATLIEARGLPAEWLAGTVQAAPAPPIRLTRDFQAARIGRAIARAVHGLGRNANWRGVG